jgi:2-haloacid dehalogenase
VHVLFDLNGTLLDPGALTDRWPGGRGAALRVLDDAVWQAHADTLTGEFRPFPEYVRAALSHRATVLGVDAALVEQGVEAAKRLPPFPDARDALRALHDAGHTTSVLTNSAADAARAALAAAGLLDGLEQVIGCDAVGAYKPDPRTYRHALEALGAEAASTWMVAGHWWDVLGARRAGLRTAWVGRDEGALLPSVPTPDAGAADLVTAAQRILQSS